MVSPENMCSSNIIWMYTYTYRDEMTINEKKKVMKLEERGECYMGGL